ncbi:Metallo-dependent phosphatase [Pilatotrama ljubarskyi]|nr:Metallo-dependent phosphatase [Pilatotrama ljubarskyi]
MGPRKPTGLVEHISKRVSASKPRTSQAQKPVYSIPTPWEQFRSSPKQFIARRAYALYASLRHRHKTFGPRVQKIRIVCVADTHNLHARLPRLPPGDILIHAGDLTDRGTEKELRGALNWLRATRYKHKVFIAGNHDRILHKKNEREQILASYPDLIYLQDSLTTLRIRDRDFTIYGTPRMPYYSPKDRFSFTDDEAAREWTARIPGNLDVLVTHGPPMGHLDIAGLGCKHLAMHLWRARPRIHVFGHLHGGRGVVRADYSASQALYEAVSLRGAGWWSVLRLVYATMLLKMRLKTPGRSLNGTTLVNASSMPTEPDKDRLLEAIVIELPLNRPKPQTFKLPWFVYPITGEPPTESKK